MGNKKINTVNSLAALQLQGSFFALCIFIKNLLYIYSVFIFAKFGFLV